MIRATASDSAVWHSGNVSKLRLSTALAYKSLEQLLSVFCMQDLAQACKQPYVGNTTCKPLLMVIRFAVYVWEEFLIFLTLAAVTAGRLHYCHDLRDLRACLDQALLAIVAIVDEPACAVAHSLCMQR